LLGQHHIFQGWLSHGGCDRLCHLRRIALHKRQLVSTAEQEAVLQLALLRLLVHRLRLVQTIEGLVGPTEVVIVETIIWLKAQRFASFLQVLVPVS
jgi:hypothetical protein